MTTHGGEYLLKSTITLYTALMTFIHVMMSDANEWSVGVPLRVPGGGGINQVNRGLWS